MFSIVITERGGAQRQLDFDSPEVSIGRLEDNEICLPKNNVSKRHSRLVLKDDRYVLVDLKSTNGTYVNGRKIASPMVVRAGDKIYIGDFILTLVRPSRPAPRMAEPAPPRRISSVQRDALPEPGPRAPAGAAGAASGRQVPQQVPPSAPSASGSWPLSESRRGVDSTAPQARISTPAPAAPGPRAAREPVAAPAGARRPSMPPRVEDPASGQGPATSPAALAPSVRLQGALHTLMERLSTRMDTARGNEGAFPSEHQRTLDGIIDQLAQDGVIGPDLDRRFLTQAAVSEAVGLGPLDRLLNNHAVREVVVDGPSRVLADLGGGLSAVSSFFSSSAAVHVVARRLLARAGRELSDQAVQQALLPDGSQLQVLMPPLSAQGPLISVRCPPRAPASPEGLVTEGVLSIDMLSLLRTAVRTRRNVLVAGPMASGVSTVLGAVASLSHDHERIVALQDAPTLAIDHPCLLRLNRQGSGHALDDLLEHVRRLRPDRVVIDDVRPKDALPLLMSAAATPGMLLGMHAPSPTLALEQLELFAQVELGGSRSSLAGLIARAVCVLVHVAPDADGSRRVQRISEVRGAHDETLEIATVYRYDGGFKPGEHKASFV